MPDVRLIDANKLQRWLKTTMANANPLHCDIKETYSECITMVNVMETIDAVPVVRCRECKHWSGRKDKPGEVTAIGYCDHQNHRIMPLNANWFCADCEKMDGGAEV